MIPPRFCRISFAIALLTACGGLLSSQTLPRDQEQLIWEVDRVVRITSMGRVYFEGTTRKKTHEVQLGPGIFSPYHMDFADGAFWVCLPDRLDDKQNIKRLYRSLDGKNREPVAWVPSIVSEGPVLGLYPLPDDRFLLISKRLFRKGKEVSFLAVGRMNEHQQVSIDNLIPVDLGTDALKGAESRQFDEDPHHLLYLSSFPAGRVRGQDFMLFVNSMAARVVVLDLETLHTRLARVFPGIPDKAYWTDEFFDFEHALLGIQPRRNGHFTLATRSEKAVLEARKTEIKLGLNRFSAPPEATINQAKNLSTADRENPTRIEIRKAIESDGLVQFPDILWWDLDPETGKVTKIESPPGAPFEIHHAAKLREFRFRVTAKDEIKVFD